MALKPRPPIITIMGHVDHGKTTLLDYLRKTNVQGKEAGGITQHIGAYQIEFQGKSLTFIDTPGHAAFNKMRQRGAQVTDLVILVVSAKDGVQPQTVESIEFIKESGVSYIVALNKMDLEGAKPDQVKAELAEHEVVVHDFGGEIDAVEISAKTGKGVDQLLENVTVLAELLELKADVQAPLEAVVIESTKDQYKGPIARVIVQQGSLKIRQELKLEETDGRVRSLIDERGKKLKKVQPGSPAEVLGLNDVPAVGSIIREAGVEYPELKEVAADEESAEFEWSDLDFDALMGEKEKLNLIVKTDVKGTLEAVTQAVDEEAIEIILAEAGPVSEGDIEMAEASNALIVVFSQKVPNKMLNLAKQLEVKIKQYDVIYHLLEDLEKHKERILNPRAAEKELGRAEILQIFEINGQQIAGVKVVTGEINKHDKVHLIRDEEIIQDVQISSLKHGKEDIETVKAKSEAGIQFKNKKLDFKEGDELMAYTIEV